MSFRTKAVKITCVSPPFSIVRKSYIPPEERVPTIVENKVRKNII
jgi:hypothetical protein